MATSALPEKRLGLAYWMARVLEECTRAEHDFSSDPVHDLRTSLRRCRSMADGIRVFDPDASWKKMRRAGKDLFSSLGQLRDTQVMIEWVEKVAPQNDVARNKLETFLLDQEREHKATAALALKNFDRRQWNSWAATLPARASRIPLGSRAFAHLALERFLEAHNLHLRALRNRTNVALHELRIGIKHFRYTVENFLPGLHEAWGHDLKCIQDSLGDIHDLDVLWHTLLQLKVFPDAALRAEWRARVEVERSMRLDRYRAKMVGSNSLWRKWRAALPNDEELREIGLDRLRVWASFLDPDISHSKRVTRLALELFDGLPSDTILRSSERARWRSVLHAAALMHEVGRTKSRTGYHKSSARLMRKIPPPLGWTARDLQVAALVVRYHRGALPHLTHKLFGALSPLQQRLVRFLAGILRLACACDSQYDGKIADLQVECVAPMITVTAHGYMDSTSRAEHIAAARHLLELTYGRPVFIVAAKEKPHAHAA